VSAARCAALDAVAPVVEPPIDAIAAPVQPAVDAIPPAIQAARRPLVSGALGALRPAVEPPIHAIAPAIEPMLDAIAAAIQPLLDPIAPVSLLGQRGGARDDQARRQYQRIDAVLCHSPILLHEAPSDTPVKPPRRSEVAGASVARSCRAARRQGPRRGSEAADILRAP
jgi:hypothetical protein